MNIYWTFDRKLVHRLIEVCYVWEGDSGKENKIHRSEIVSFPFALYSYHFLTYLYMCLTLLWLIVQLSELYWKFKELKLRFIALYSARLSEDFFVAFRRILCQELLQSQFRRDETQIYNIIFYTQKKQQFEILQYCNLYYR